MARTPQDVTDAELGILQVLWDDGPAPIRRLTDSLYPQGGVSQYATVQKLLERLEAKGYVRRDRSASVHVFAAAVGRDELIGRRLRSIADKLCGGSLTPLLSHLLQSGPLSAEDRQSLRQIIEDMDTRGHARSRTAGPPKPRR
jgi:predicted transcriptional regulator